MLPAMRRSYLRNGQDSLQPPQPVPASATAAARLRSLTSPFRAPRDRSTYLEDDDIEQHTLISSTDDLQTQFASLNHKSLAQPDELTVIPTLGQALYRLFTSSRFTMISLLAVAIVAIVSLFVAARHSLYVLYLRFNGVPPGLYSRDGSLYLGLDTRFHVKGFSWFGMEEHQHVLGGLAKTSMQNIFTFAKQNNFNAIRIPLSIQNYIANPITKDGIGTFHNPELSNVRYIDALRIAIRAAAANHILILLDVHRLSNDDIQSKGLWYDENFPEEKLFEVWKGLASEFSGEWNVIGADLFNEPWRTTWGDAPINPIYLPANSTTTHTDWKILVESLGNEIHRTCPSWLIFAEGLGNLAGSINSGAFWSENLRVMQRSPPSLKLSSKIVLSPHVYGPSVFEQKYFKKDNFTDGMPAIWDDHFGLTSNVTGIATVIGEWGGTFEGKDAVWQNKFFEYIFSKQIGFFYWCLNPESSDTHGLLKHDWRTPVRPKIELLSQAPYTDVKENVRHFQKWRNWRV